MQILEHILKIRREKAKQEFWQSVGNHLALRNWHCQLRIANFALRKFCSHKTLFICLTKASKSFAKFRIANFAMWFANFRIAKFAMWFANSLRTALRNSQLCELIANFPTVLPSDFVLRITFSSELRFRRFWYRWKA